MKLILKCVFSVLSLTMISCNTKEIKKETVVVEKKEEKLTKSDSIINGAIKAHGGDLYDKASYKFIFRKRQYSFTNNGASYKYSIERTEKDKQIVDILENGTITRTIDGVKTELNDRDKARYSESLNSVIYFATLPYKLNDKAVNKKYKGEIEIKNQNYYVVEITFKKEGGGKDFDDEFHYWVNTNTNTIDYLAYNYRVNKGGVRFRSAYNRRNVEGVIFQDYINFKAEVGTPLAKLPELYEKGELKELSRIETENVVSLSK